MEETAAPTAGGVGCTVSSQKNMSKKVIFNAPADIEPVATVPTGVSSTPTDPQPLQHMGWGCDGVTGKGSKMNIYPCTFQKLFQNIEKDGVEYVLIPLLQRTYCWTDVQIQTWWRDANGKSPHVNTDVGHGHATGKCIFKLASADGVAHAAEANAQADASATESANKGPDGARLSSAAATSPAQDRRGKCLLCIDGQQRITTQSLLYAAVRDCLLKRLLELQRDLILVTQFQDETRLPAGKDADAAEASLLRETEARIRSIILPMRQLVEELERLLFSGKYVGTMLAYIDCCVERAMDNGAAAPGSTELVNPLGLVEGREMPFSGCATLLPSYVDRAPFFELLLMGRFNYTLCIARLHGAVKEAHAAGERGSTAALHRLLEQYSLMNVDITDLTDRYLSFCDGTVQRIAKHYFDERMEGYAWLGLRSRGGDCRPNSAADGAETSMDIDVTGAARISPTVESIAAAVELTWAQIGRVRKLLPSIHKMSLMYCEIESEINMAQAFMYLQEQSLFSMGALLQNPTPGRKFATCDWVRNLCLSCVMHGSIQVQEQWYKERWLQPLVLNPPKKLDLDLLIRNFLLSEGVSVELNVADTSPKKRSPLRPAVISESDEDSSVNTVVGSLISKASDLLGRPPMPAPVAPATAEAHISTMEAKLLELLKMHLANSAIPPPPHAVALYSKFVSYIEAAELRLLISRGEPLPPKGSAFRITETTCDMVLTKLAKFAENYVPN